ncbi:MAG: NADH-quinone oxidoreductase subunit NuoN [Azoarcus sp.]|jgi:NADH-quinone oxidoreductase subunit N|nr:NADH-quinone oxidoreductase subunit NuoN [Azoarcus sp.]
MNFVLPDLYPATAEILVALMALVLMLATAFARGGARVLAYVLAQFTLAAAAFATVATLGNGVDHTFGNMFVHDLLGSLLKLAVYLAMMIALLYGRAWLADRRLDRPEYYLLALLMTLGMMVMISASHLLTLYIGLEMMSLALYALVAFDRDAAPSIEAGMKYFVLGALASGLLLYGMSMIYGATGALELPAIAQAVASHSVREPVLLLGLVFLVAGISFKLGVVPFHMWAPDVYQGAPTAVTLILATAPKLAAFALAVRLLPGGLSGLAAHWQSMLMFVAAASIVLGNLAALAQHDIKRMLAYSGISHMGFMLLGLLSGGADGNAGLAVNAYGGALFYAIAYVLMSLAAFGMVIFLSRAGFEAGNIEDFKGLNRRSPWFAVLMLFVMFSMAGVPFFIGFFAKFAVLQSVVAAGHYWLAALAVAMSVIGAFYYLRVVKLMYFDDPVDNAPLQAPAGVQVMLSINGIAIAALGLAPEMLLALCAQAMRASVIAG